MCCFALLFVFLGPRFAVLMIWIFGDRVELAFDGWLLPLAGLLFLPWTTLMYLLMWSRPGRRHGRRVDHRRPGRRLRHRDVLRT